MDGARQTLASRIEGEEHHLQPAEAKVPKAVEKSIASQSGEKKEEVKVEPPTPLMKKAETLKDEISCLLSLITEVGKGETMLLMGDIMTISTTISEHVSTLAFEAYKTLNAPARA